MKNFQCVMESEKKFLLVRTKAKDIDDAGEKFSSLAFAISRLEDFRIIDEIIEIRESWEKIENGEIFPTNSKIIRVREK